MMWLSTLATLASGGTVMRGRASLELPLVAACRAARRARVERGRRGPT